MEQLPDPQTLKRNRIKAIILATINGLMLIAIVYAYVHKGLAEERLMLKTKSVDSLQTQLAKCAEEARMLQAISEHNAMVARQAQQAAEIKPGKK